MDKNLQTVFIVGGVAALLLFVFGKKNKVMDLTDEPVDDTGIVNVNNDFSENKNESNSNGFA